MSNKSFLGRLTRSAATKWLVAVVVFVICVLAAWISTAAASKEYTARCQLYVSPAASSPPGEAYQGAMMAQERVTTYKNLVTSDRVTQKAVAALGIDMSPTELASRISVDTTAQSVFMTVSVVGDSGGQAKRLATEVCHQLLDAARWGDSPDDKGGPIVALREVTVPSLPTSPSSPKVSRDLLIGVVAGVLLGAAVIVGWGRLGNRRTRLAGPTNDDQDPHDDGPPGISDALTTDQGSGPGAARAAIPNQDFYYYPAGPTQQGSTVPTEGMWSGTAPSDEGFRARHYADDYAEGRSLRR